VLEATSKGINHKSFYLFAKAQKIGKGLTGKAFREGHTMYCSDFWSDQNFEHDLEIDETTHQSGLIAVLVTLVIIANKMGSIKNLPAINWYKRHPA
jgi:hypothetical protein